MKKHLVFVYGTLRRYEQNHHLLKNAECLADKCWIKGDLFDSGSGYPYLVLTSQDWVFGELYQVNDNELEALDLLEEYYGPGKDNYYDRVVQSVHTESGDYEAFVYVLPEGRQQPYLVQIKEGDWCVYRLKPLQ
ncbi:gamma-glutamylcyclotransferase [Paenibacillus sp. BSR1-1]|uniref:gamma-glutamylcyclotransferase family protein n=1 Tax=Paenibacillus sp. BSR1-1 TaxID=3020845 RepID=UPI0025B0EE33|nr:gamma-glutamylcyclotransferase family protein [Paenibacillus sp. BSR1-1]MDN3015454.1 gamma-glutamylcyclotransferase [Paenibacillus sp. BSR1-1]